MNSNIYRTALAAMRKQAADPMAYKTLKPSNAQRPIYGANTAINKGNNGSTAPAWGAALPNVPIRAGDLYDYYNSQPWVRSKLQEAGHLTAPTSGAPNWPVLPGDIYDYGQERQPNFLDRLKGLPAYLKQRSQDQYRPRLPKTV